MSGIINFTGSALFLSAVSQINSSLIRLTYSQIPLAASSSGANDALNILNYTISGPASNSISTINVVESDTRSFDIQLASPLATGTWTISVENVETPGSDVLINPKSLNFDVVLTSFSENLSQGGQNHSSEDNLRSYISPALRGRYWDALIAALGTADTYLKTLAINAFDQLFIPTASGKYLDRLASNEGISRSVGTGISDDSFRDLILKISNNKITIQSFLEVLETFYGKDALRAHIDSEIEPFSIFDDETLIVEVDGKLINVIFNQNDFRSAYSVKAIEVASIINKYFELNKVKATAVAYKDVELDAYKVRIYSGALGLRGKIRILGGKAQNSLNFEQKLETLQDVGTTWQVSTPPNVSGLAANRAKMAFTAGTDPVLSLVQVGDYVNIYGSAFSENNRGTFEIVRVENDFFEIINLLAEQQNTVVQLDVDDVLFYRPVLKNININQRISFAANGNLEETDVFLAATAEIVERDNNSGAYLKLNEELDISENYLPITSIERTRWKHSNSSCIKS